jgi:hypothetical protein
VAAGVEPHALEQHAVALLEVRPLGDRGAGAVQALGEVVAQALQLAEAEQARAAATGDRPVGVRPRVGGEEGGGQLALELGDLVAERATGGGLVGLDNGR